MPIEIISKRERVTKTWYVHRWQTEDGGGWSHECSAEGVPVPFENECIAGSWKRYTDNGVPKQEVTVDGRVYYYEGIKEESHSYIESAVGRCHCGSKIGLGGFTNTCDCGREYNMSGQLLAPRSQWGTETGETADEIVRPFRNPENFSD